MFKKTSFLFLVLALALCLSAANAETVTVNDMFGREVTLEGPVERVIVLQPGDCEILFALGCGNALVGRGAYCDYPDAVLEVPAVQSGAETNLEEILALEPQLVITSDMAFPEEQVNLLTASGVPVLVTEADSIAETYAAIHLIGQAMGREAEAEALIADMQSTFDAIASQSARTDKTVYFEVMPLEWGLWSAGASTFMHELAEMCGVQNAFADIEGWQSISQEQVIERNPDYIVLVTGMGDTAVDEVLSRPGWQDIKAVRSGLVYNADSYTLTRPSPRLKQAAVELYRFFSGEDLATE